MTLVLTQIMELIRSRLEPEFEGGCQRFKQSGNKAALELPCAILRWVDDDTSALEAPGIAGGRRQKIVRCSVELHLWHDEDKADPNTFTWSDQAAEAEIAKADKVLSNLANDTALRELSRDADILGIRWVMGGIQRAGGITRAGITFSLRYAHQDLDPEAKA